MCIRHFFLQKYCQNKLFSMPQWLKNAKFHGASPRTPLGAFRAGPPPQSPLLVCFTSYACSEIPNCGLTAPIENFWLTPCSSTSLAEISLNNLRAWFILPCWMKVENFLQHFLYFLLSVSLSSIVLEWRLTHQLTL